MNRELLDAIGLEAIFTAVQHPLAREGIMLDRRVFAATPGWPLLLPITAIEMARMGAAVAGWQMMVTPPPKMPQIGLNG